MDVKKKKKIWSVNPHLKTTKSGIIYTTLAGLSIPTTQQRAEVTGQQTSPR